MIRSMTGFGRASFALAGLDFELEVRAVNHRFLELRVKLPRVAAPLEAEVRARVQARVARGKLEVIAQQPAGLPGPSELEIDLALARRYVEAAAELQRRYGVPGDLPVEALLALPGVARLGEREPEPEDLRAALLAALDTALDQADAMREAEGTALARELVARLGRVDALAAEIAARAGEVQLQARERLRKRAEKLAQETGLRDEARLHQEVVFAADRLDITEELVRLRSHVEQFRAALERAGPGEPSGRRLDFLLQELSREANTIGAKCADAPVAHCVVELKTELERVREQVQNVE